MDLTTYSDVPSETLGTYCRFCFRDTSLVPIFHPATMEPLNRELLTIVADCTGIFLSAESDFPSSACQSCLQLMQEFYHFRRRSREYNKLIRTKMLSRLEPEVIIVKKEVEERGSECDELKEEEEDEGDGASSSSSTLTAEESSECAGMEDKFRLSTIFNAQATPFTTVAAMAAAAAAAAAAASAKPIVTSGPRQPYGYARQRSATSSGAMPPIAPPLPPPAPLEENRCMVCGEKFSSRNVWITHLAVHATERPFQCHICLAQFKTKYVQQNHIRTVHENVRSYRCPICIEPMRQFKSKRTLEDHMRYHTGERPFECCICKMSFSSGSVHRNHMYRVHREMRKKDRRCSYCGKIFDRILDLKRHQTSYCEKIIGREMAERL